MSQFAVSWRLCRGRFLDAITDLNSEQLNWRMHKDALTLGESALHVAGVEVSFASQLLGLSLNDFESKLKASATDGVVNALPFPFSPEEITPDLIVQAFQISKEMVEPILDNPSEELLTKEIVSALGPIITGEGALARLAFHPGYHQGQAHLVRTAPGFPQ